MTSEHATRRCAVLGSPIAHSLSPDLHTAAYEYLGLPWVYERYEVDAAGLGDFLRGLDASWRGLSLTMPLKEVALDYMDDVSGTARAVEAVNTVLVEDDGRLSGANTDVPGMVNSLRGRGVSKVANGTVLGGGATARSALAAMTELADTATVFVRTSARAEQLLATAARLGLPCTIRRWDERADGLGADVVIVTTPVGASDDLADAVPATPGALLDVVYDTGPTPLSLAWAAHGGVVVDGLDLLGEQALLQVSLMTGRDVPRSVVTNALERRRAT